MPPLVAVIPATNAGIEIAKSCFRASILLRTSGNLRKAHILLAAVLAEIKGNPAMEIYAKVQRDKLLKIYDE
ncbi:hypothetical protein PILCRDRAFT_819925 [Piloderma croceum F 1598]|uniref:Uncharacterized protein n=1 Tax=Piloderma croceum (strain F 1598) TaxID=765440 RepID=A0A0C3FFB2_PILCF|nr:hypothetical protein PILCRDRAFT_819925 [Piloderma croceum F 1598]